VKNRFQILPFKFKLQRYTAGGAHDSGPGEDEEEPMYEKPADWDDEEDGTWMPPDDPEIAERE
jgi:hypothetical protein